jgi:TonB family protein
MLRKEWIGLALALCLSPAPLWAETLSVVHAETPKFADETLWGTHEVVSGTVRVRVRIDAAGNVIASSIEEGLGLDLDMDLIAGAAARLWKFNPSAGGETREALLSFVLDQRFTPAEPTHEEVSMDGPLTLHVVDKFGTIRWLPRENGKIPEKRCPVHGTLMAVEQLEMSYGLPQPTYSVHDTPKGRRLEAQWDAYLSALDKAERTLFPESHSIAEAGTGCYVPFPETKAEVYYCQACRDAEKAWRESHPEPAKSD